MKEIYIYPPCRHSSKGNYLPWKNIVKMVVLNQWAKQKKKMEGQCLGLQGQSCTSMLVQVCRPLVIQILAPYYRILLDCYLWILLISYVHLIAIQGLCQCSWGSKFPGVIVPWSDVPRVRCSCRAQGSQGLGTLKPLSIKPRDNHTSRKANQGSYSNKSGRTQGRTVLAFICNH